MLFKSTVTTAECKVQCHRATKSNTISTFHCFQFSQVTTMSQNLRKAFKTIIQKTSWMDAATRNTAEEKVRIRFNSSSYIYSMPMYVLKSYDLTHSVWDRVNTVELGQYHDRDALATCIARSSAAMISTLWNRQVLGLIWGRISTTCVISVWKSGIHGKYRLCSFWKFQHVKGK